jgi:hypothetical protein
LHADGKLDFVEEGWETQYWSLGDQIAFGGLGIECYTHRMKGTPIGISLSTIVDIDAKGIIITECGKRFSYAKGEVDEKGQRMSGWCDLSVPAHIMHRLEKGDRTFRHFKNVGPLKQDVTLWFPEDQPEADQDYHVGAYTHAQQPPLLLESEQPEQVRLQKLRLEVLDRLTADEKRALGLNP